MRWLIMWSRAGEDPWVLAETSDEDFASTSGDFYQVGTVGVSRDDALADPALRSAVVAWDEGDDRGYVAHEAADAAESIVYEAAVQIELDKLPPDASEEEQLEAIRRVRTGGDEVL
jgi:hypothetical protein